jgi:lipoprotein-anchoring transpeptidase ErfK/SrfK
MVSASRSFAAHAAVAGAAGAMLLTSCSPPALGGDKGPASNARQAAAKPVNIAIAPPDGSLGVALDAPVVVAAHNGRLQSVKLIKAGAATPVVGEFSSDGTTWHSTDGLDSRASYTVFATAGSGGAPVTAQASFHTLTAQGRLLTTVSPSDGSVVGIGEPIDLRFDEAIPADRRADLLRRVSISSTPGVVGAWHWFSANDVHFRTQNYWPSGTHVSVSAQLKGFNVGDGTWGQGDWTASFTVGQKRVSMIDDLTHTMSVYQDDQLIDTWPVSMGKAGFKTIEGTLVVLYRSYVVKMNSCTTFGGAACIPGSANYYDEKVYYDTAISSDGYFIHSAPWSVYAQGHYDVSHGCVNLSPARATAFFNWSQPGDVVVISHTGNAASSQDGEGDWQLPFTQFDNAGMGTVWTGPTRTADSGARAA